MKILDIITETTTPASSEAIAQAWILRNPEKHAAYLKTLEKQWTLGTSIMKYFKYGNVWGPSLLAGAKVWALEQIAKEPLDTFRKSDPAFAAYTDLEKAQWISRARDEIFGIWFAQYAVQGMIRGCFASASLLGAFLRTVGGVAGVAVSKKGNGFSIGSAIFEEAMIATAQFWIQSPSGTKWLKEVIGPAFFNAPGAVITTSWDWLVDKVEEWTGVNVNKELTPNIDDAVKKTVAADTTGITWKDPAKAAKDYADFEKRTRSTNITGKAPGEL
jgi:hypothetical protein